MSATETAGPSSAESTARRPPPPAPGGPGRPRLRRWLAGRGGDRLGGGWPLAVWAAAFLGLLLQAPGRIVFDTKLDLVLTPGGFLGRLGHLWNPRQGFGGLQDQAVGYAFPMGPFYAIAEGIGLPPWIVERMWMALIVTVAFWGTVRLTERLAVGTTGSRLVGGLAYALWPTLTALVGSTSAAVLPLALLPWVLVPLADGARAGSSPLLCAARSGVAVLCMGGVNAVSVLAVLPAPLLYLLTRTAGPRRRALLGWWLAAVALITAWWWLPLLLLAGYGFDFLPYIETPHTTASTMAATEALRGTGNWLDYLNFGSPALPSGWVLVSTGWAVAGTGFVAALGLGGLARSEVPEARWLRWSVCAGAVATMAVYPGRLGGPFHGPLQDFLNGPGEAFHSVYKFQPLIALPLVIGLIHLLGRPLPRMPLLRGAVAVLLAAGLLGAALPYLGGRVLQSGSFTAVPGYWKDTATYLAGHGGDGRALLEPAASHGYYAWGTTTDDALQPYAESSWVQRTLIPMGGAGSQRYLDAAERAMTSGSQVPGLAAYLARGGIRYVVVRHDLDPAQFEFVSPALYHRTLQLSGFRLVTGFGPVTPASPIRSGTPLQIQAIDQQYRAVEIYEAVDPTLRPEDPVSVLAESSAVQLSGGPESLLPASAGGLLDGRAVTLTGDATGSDTGPLIVTDGLRRTDTSFGLIRDNVSYTYTPSGTNPPGRADGSGGDPPRQLLLQFPAAGHQTTAVIDGAASVTASTYGSWLLQSPAFDPVNAFDGDARTAWVEGSAGTPVGQWLRTDFGRRIDLSDGVKVRLLADSSFRPVATRITVTTDTGSVTDTVTPDDREQTLRAPEGATTTLKLTIAAAKGAVPGGFGAGISEVSIPDVRITRFLRAPHDTPTSGPGGVVYSFQRQTAGSGIAGSGNPETQLARIFTTDRDESFTARLSALPAPGPALDRLLETTAQDTGDLKITGSPALGGLPQFRPANLIDGSYLTGWIAAGPDPALHLSWTGRRTIGDLYLEAAEGISAPPLSVRISSPDGVREGQVESDGHVVFRPALRTDRIDLTFPQVKRLTVYDAVTGTRLPLPLGLAEVHFPALADLRHTPAGTSRTFQLPCGSGPAVTVDGTAYQTSASGTLGDLTAGLPVRVTLCIPDQRLVLGAGEHRLSSPGSGVPLAVTDAVLTGGAANDSLGNSAPTSRPVRALTQWEWGDEDRSVHVGTGPEAYLEVHENRADGWTATLNGKELRAVTLDGWQQAYVIPAGETGTVRLHYDPAGAYHLALAVGVVLALLVVAVACGAFGRRRGEGRPEAGERPPRELTGPVVAVLVLVVVGGPMALAAVAIALLARWRPSVAPAVAVTAMTAAAIVAAVAAQDGLAPGRGAFGPVAQALALTALAAALPPGAPAYEGPRETRRLERTDGPYGPREPEPPKGPARDPGGSDDPGPGPDRAAGRPGPAGPPAHEGPQRPDRTVPEAPA
ncbi:alpha-(1-_3)-arabinofuranosyltransferase family protein [Streptomyces sp. H10-C2]|uniref:alpha-(1->3)-arabinofuranosyltransferase domain-containing protein n=1 Tax=unclassified Streptomyces TaxID=2593676 RepID=UPI0024BAAA80|nr:MULTISPECIES: alpha-(1->3)-arabinofuranosyltransferase family protein [unclassified Streptomyces]MDJ0340889.1 alpha-(1->3)-arabinofuranosyltransferase family protein [Streptomyces sp. PH10-H1]MDJ0369880.1 alpha-(1->3)-arabinofuranosyltransferase family protein [Streptomyces sp. H10-C2]